MIKNFISKFRLAEQLLSKILDHWAELAIYLFNGVFIGVFLNFSLLAASQEIAIDYSLLQKLFNYLSFSLFICSLICLISSFHPLSKKFFMGCALLLIGFLLFYV